jgi:hypothetical protein
VVKQGRLGPVDDLVFAAPEEQLAEDLGEHPGCSHHEVDGGGEGGIQVRVPDELPAGFVDERESDVVDDEVEVGKFAAAPSMSQVWVCSIGCGPRGCELFGVCECL